MGLASYSDVLSLYTMIKTVTNPNGKSASDSVGCRDWRARRRPGRIDPSAQLVVKETILRHAGRRPQSFGDDPLTLIDPRNTFNGRCTVPETYSQDSPFPRSQEGSRKARLTLAGNEAEEQNPDARVPVAVLENKCVRPITTSVQIVVKHSPWTVRLPWARC